MTQARALSLGAKAVLLAVLKVWLVLVLGEKLVGLQIRSGTKWVPQVAVS